MNANTSRTPQKPANDMPFDRIPPHDDQAEQATLGGMLISQDAIGEACAIIGTSDFYQPRHQTIHDAIMTLYAKGHPVDAVTVANELTRTGRLDAVGGVDYLHTLVATVPTAANVAYYADIVHQRAILRRVIQAGTKIAQLGYNAEQSHATAEDVVNLAQAAVYATADDKSQEDYQPIQSIVGDVLKMIDDAQKHKNKPGVPTGFHDIDQAIQGLQPGQMVVVAGRPAMGKSTLGIDFARAAALHHHMTTIVFSLEMSRSELGQRIISAEASVPLTALRRADEITDEQWHRMNTLLYDIENAPLFLDDSPNMSLMEIRAKCRRLKQNNDLKLVVIDYLQLMTTGRHLDSRQQEVSEMSRALKLLARELNVPVVALSQLNRGPEMRADKRPQLSDLRESGSIEQDADVVFLVHRPGYYDKDDRKNEADIIMAKCRNGQPNDFTLRFEGQYSRFTEPQPTPDL
ncbi:replicative DNA helicase [Bifidobacterium rousetti]|uniref:replicative DNA helicase n=1 Tax=Bifidobacterium rousetti TaxID=2045439 RepID=UPI001239A775|nr:replicative DNA helicase [Bifidobacterium rousetti]KAA8816094.1 replicative DNA helicase [Bifidobacterium rousetti]